MKLGRLTGIIALCLTFSTVAAFSSAAQSKVQLTMGSWRADDVTQMTKLLAAFSQKYPNIQIKFDPTNPPDYNAALRLQLQSGIGPDLMDVEEE